ncbi:MAG: serine protease [Coleofasciculus sp. C1-SOL-03]|uniref:S1 family peptidase n=1 Tax=Coleofasciculus sp. C1-SOL-03 TaxID=3069522 RepID=UPI00330298EF
MANAAKMNWYLLIMVTCTGSLLITLSVVVLNVSFSNPRDVFPIQIGQKQDTLSVKQLDDLAQTFTVKVLSKDTWGSGVILYKQGQVYTVLTAEHILVEGDSHRIQTPDGHLYRANWLQTIHLNGNDLALLQFQSPDESYPVASLDTSYTLTVGDQVFAAGFSSEAEPSNPKGFVYTTGQISLLPEQAFERGYQIGYTNRVEKGMSGGPLLNYQGKLIGINGMDKYPLWGNPYVFKDGSVPSTEVQQQMRHLSWAIPLHTFVELVPESLKSSLVVSPLFYEQIYRENSLMSTVKE